MPANAFSPAVSWGDVFEGVAKAGYAYVPGGIIQPFLGSLQTEANGLEYRQETFANEKVRLEYQSFGIWEPEKFSQYPQTHALITALNTAVANAASTFSGLDDYAINRASYQKYQPGEIGVTPHLDPTYNRVLVFVITVSGKGEFGVVNDRQGADIREKIITEAGDIILLRAPGFNGIEDGRVLHYARPVADSERISLGLRMEIKRSQ